MPDVTSRDLDRILDAIRAEARARGSKGPLGIYSKEAPAHATVAMSAGSGLPAPDIGHVGDFLALPLDVFLPLAYRHLLGRDIDPGGGAHYQRQLLRGRLTRVEVLARLRYSPEGRARSQRLPDNQSQKLPTDGLRLSHLLIIFLSCRGL